MFNLLFSGVNDMGWSIDRFFIDLFEILNADYSAAKKVRKLIKFINAEYIYAKECGYIGRDPDGGTKESS